MVHDKRMRHRRGDDSRYLRNLFYIRNMMILKARRSINILAILISYDLWYGGVSLPAETGSLPPLEQDRTTRLFLGL